MNQGRYSGGYNYIGRSQDTLKSIVISKSGSRKHFFQRLDLFYVRGLEPEGCLEKSQINMLTCAILQTLECNFPPNPPPLSLSLSLSNMKNCFNLIISNQCLFFSKLNLLLKLLFTSWFYLVDNKV